MTDYRLYFLKDNHIRRVVELECESDVEALGLAERHRGGDTMELWQRSRLVKRFEPQQP
jgi:hypothetical protein